MNQLDRSPAVGEDLWPVIQNILVARATSVQSSFDYRPTQPKTTLALSMGSLNAHFHELENGDLTHFQGAV